MTTLKQVFSLEGLTSIQWNKGEHHTLSLKTGKGKSRKGFSWGVETALKKNLKGFVLVTSELSKESISEMYSEYKIYGEYGEKVKDVDVIFVSAYNEPSKSWLVNELETYSNSSEYCLVLDSVRLQEEDSIEDLIVSIEKHKLYFNQILATQQAKHIFQ